MLITVPKESWLMWSNNTISKVMILQKIWLHSFLQAVVAVVKSFNCVQRQASYTNLSSYLTSKPYSRKRQRKTSQLIEILQINNLWAPKNYPGCSKSMLHVCTQEPHSFTQKTIKFVVQKMSHVHQIPLDQPWIVTILSNCFITALSIYIYTHSSSVINFMSPPLSLFVASPSSGGKILVMHDWLIGAQLKFVLKMGPRMVRGVCCTQENCGIIII